MGTEGTQGTWARRARHLADSSCSSSYIGEICRHFKTRIEEHTKKDNKSHIFKHVFKNRNIHTVTWETRKIQCLNKVNRKKYHTKNTKGKKKGKNNNDDNNNNNNNKIIITLIRKRS